MHFNHDWWFGGGFQEQLAEARRRCARSHFPDLDPAAAEKDGEYKKFHDGLEARTIVYLRDGFSYEIKELIPRPVTTALTFECTPADEAYRVGSFVVTVPHDDVVRVEVFAVHPDEKPEDMPSIKGFGSAQVPPSSKIMEDRTRRREATEREEASKTES